MNPGDANRDAALPDLLGQETVRGQVHNWRYFVSLLQAPCQVEQTQRAATLKAHVRTHERDPDRPSYA